MLTALLVLSLASAPTQDPAPTPEEVGAIAFLAGVCSEVGYDLDRGAVIRLSDASASVEPDIGAWLRRHEAGAAGLESKMTAEIEAVGGDAAKAGAWARSVVVRCDELATRWPGTITRGPAAEPRIDEWIRSFD
ncbi:MAG: hypothetical protein KJ676_10625 [Alphaproteobacteria bacterium]|nr:hypothetical protein [Alphaproteobacteria bacterium]MBU1526798.1 hypothetical protein [Alphaproteobacteria bacterium]MBU2116854.1 hypothetical protein [Alphaproteobacteria bacterium]MBU2351633.1 hypothetical protein [Alphaproteobacteria bacterium]MBU2381302.1 hypothetical protein [Alphaproteobacteria bacterium]